MSKIPKPFEKGKGGKRLNVILTEDEFKKLNTITQYLTKKFGSRQPEATAVRAAIIHMAGEIEDGTFK